MSSSLVGMRVLQYTKSEPTAAGIGLKHGCVFLVPAPDLIPPRRAARWSSVPRPALTSCPSPDRLRCSNRLGGFLPWKTGWYTQEKLDQWADWIRQRKAHCFEALCQRTAKAAIWIDLSRSSQSPGKIQFNIIFAAVISGFLFLGSSWGNSKFNIDDFEC